MSDEHGKRPSFEWSPLDSKNCSCSKSDRSRRDVEDRRTDSVSPNRRENRQIANKSPSSYLAIEALIELACRSQRGVNWRVMYELIHERLVDMNLLPRSSSQLAPLRYMYEQMFGNLLISARNAAQSNLRIDSALQSASLSPGGSTVATAYGQRSLCLSRFLTEFQQLGTLGRGGFAAVTRCRSRVDGQLYAVKRVDFAANSVRRAAVAVREVAVLASLTHPHVVRYHTAWLEPCLSSPESRRASRFQLVRSGSFAPVEISSSRNICGSQRSADPSSLSVISWDRSTRPTAANPEIGGRFWNRSTIASRSRTSSDQSVPVHGTCGVNSPPSTSVMRSESLPPGVECRPFAGAEASRSRFSPRPCVALFIQMQLCQSTLRDWIQTRNVQLQDADSQSDRLSSVDIDSSLAMAKDLLSALSYIHFRGIVHRDIKPDNVFISADSQVLLGDFGLARYSRSNRSSLENRCKDHTECDNATVAMQNRSCDIHDTDSSNPFANLQRSVAPLHPSCGDICDPYSDRSNGMICTCNGTDGESWTVGVGTPSYAAPEQLNDVGRTSVAGTAADMFSFGLLLYELVQPFSTDSERHQAFVRLRISPATGSGRRKRQSRDVGEQLRSRWPQLADVIVELTERRPHLRPTASQLLNCGLFPDKMTTAVPATIDSRIMNALDLVSAANDSCLVQQNHMHCADDGDGCKINSISHDRPSGLDNPLKSTETDNKEPFPSPGSFSSGSDNQSSSPCSKALVSSSSIVHQTAEKYNASSQTSGEAFIAGANSSSSPEDNQSISKEDGDVSYKGSSTASRSKRTEQSQVSANSSHRRVRNKVHGVSLCHSHNKHLRVRLMDALRQASTAQKRCLVLARKLAQCERQLHHYRRQNGNKLSFSHSH